MEVYSYDSEYTVTNTIANITPHLPAAVIGIAPQTKQQNTTTFVTFFLQNTDIINLLVHHGALKKGTFDCFCQDILPSSLFYVTSLLSTTQNSPTNEYTIRVTNFVMYQSISFPGVKGEGSFVLYFV